MTSPEHVSNNPGRILKAAREQEGLSVAQAADALHLRTSVVESIESEDYKEFGSDVFLKGYFRSYCRLVNLHEDRMIELLDAQLKVRKQQQKEAENEVKKLERARVNKKILVNSLAVVIGIAVVGLAVFYAKPNASIDEKKSEPVSEQIESVESSAQILDEEKAESAGNIQTGVVNEDVAVAMTKRAPEEPTVVQTVVQTVVPLASVLNSESSNKTAITVNAEAGLPPSQRVSNETDTRPVIDNLALTQETELVIHFAGDCWLQIKSEDGKNLKAGLKKAGDEVRYSSSEPMRLILGDASVAEVTFNGEAVDLKPHTSRNSGRAELILEL